MEEFINFSSIEQRLVDKATQALIPINAGLELTPVCNLQCEMCYVRRSAPQVEAMGGVLPLAFWVERARQLKELGCCFILLSGGEPLLYPHFKELYSTLAYMGFSLRLNTNGTLITPEMADFLAQSKPRRVNVTLYGAGNDTYRSLCHAEEGYDRCIRGIELLQERGIDLCVNLTQVTKNQDDYLRMLEYAESRHIPVLVSAYISVFSNTYTNDQAILEVRNAPSVAANNELLYKNHADAAAFWKWVEEQRQYLCTACYPEVEGTALTCRAGKASCWINWKGEMQACVDLAEPRFSLKEMTVRQAWESLTVAVKQQPIHTECRHCKLKPLCDVCYANATNEKKHCGSLNYLCQMAEAKAHILMKLQP